MTTDSKSPFKYRSPLIRWIDYSRRSWQRLGHLKIVSAVAPASPGANLEGITTRFQRAVTGLHKVPNELNERVSTYIRARRPQTYRFKGEMPSQVELQDIYLSDPQLPSQSGAITGEEKAADYLHQVYVEIPTWAVRMQLLRKNNYTVTDRGKALLGILPFSTENLHEIDPTNNPFLLSPGEKCFFLYCILDADGDLIKRLYPRLLSNYQTIKRIKVGEEIAGVLSKIREERLQHPGSGAMRVMANRMLETVNSITSPRSSQSPKEHTATLRTEPLVDCGLIERYDPDSYTYRLTDHTREFIDQMASFNSLDEFLETGLTSSVARLLGLVTLQGSNQERKYLSRSYAYMRSGLGYCSIRELALLTVARALNEHSAILEIRQVEEAVRDLAREYGTGVRFSKGRQGSIALVRIDNRVIKGLGGD